MRVVGIEVRGGAGIKGERLILFFFSLVFDQKKKKKIPTSRQKQQGSSFVVCPVCFGSVPRALVDAHVAGCLTLQRQAQVESAAGGGGGTKAEQKQRQSQPPPAASAAETTTTATAKEETSPADEQQQQQQRALRPLSQVLRPQPRVGSASQRGGGSGGGGSRGRQAPAAAAAPPPSKAAPPPLSQKAPLQPPAAAAAAAAGNSAFAELMRAQRSASLSQVFSLGEFLLFFSCFRSFFLFSASGLLEPLTSCFITPPKNNDTQSTEATASSGSGAR